MEVAPVIFTRNVQDIVLIMLREDGPPRKSRSDCPISGKIISNWVEQQGTDTAVSRATNSREEWLAANWERDNCQYVYLGEWACVSNLTVFNNLLLILVHRAPTWPWSTRWWWHTQWRRWAWRRWWRACSNTPPTTQTEMCPMTQRMRSPAGWIRS